METAVVSKRALAILRSMVAMFTWWRETHGLVQDVAPSRETIAKVAHSYDETIVHRTTVVRLEKALAKANLIRRTLGNVHGRAHLTTLGWLLVMELEKQYGSDHAAWPVYVLVHCSATRVAYDDSSGHAFSCEGDFSWATHHKNGIRLPHITPEDVASYQTKRPSGSGLNQMRNSVQHS